MTKGGLFMNINFELYKLFYNVAKNKNITKTANELLMSQPGVSKAIKTLEEQVGCTLFIRNKNGVTLTEEGNIFYNEIKSAMEIIDNAEQRLLEMINLDYGFLNIGISNTLTQKYLLPYIKKFHKKYPNIKIKIHTEPTNELIVKVRNGLVDFIILNFPYDIPSDFEDEKLKDIHDCFVANNQYNYLKDKTILLNELNNYPLILLAKGSNTRYFLDNFCINLNIDLIPKFELASYSLVTEFTKAGLGIGLVTKEFAIDEIQNNSLFEIKTEPKLPSRSINVIYLKNKALNHCSQNFLKALKKKIISLS